MDIIKDKRAVGVEVVLDDRARRITAGREVVLSLGPIHTPKVLMQSGVGDEEELRRWAIPVVAYLPGVGRNFQQHVALSCIWEYKRPLAPRNNAGEATFLIDAEIPLGHHFSQIPEADYPR